MKASLRPRSMFDVVNVCPTPIVSVPKKHVGVFFQICYRSNLFQQQRWFLMRFGDRCLMNMYLILTPSSNQVKLMRKHKLLNVQVLLLNNIMTGLKDLSLLAKDFDPWCRKQASIVEPSLRQI